jgi:glycosyltransferase involved in cell wall biosynthesis
MAEWLTVKLSPRIVSDARAIQRYYEDTYDCPSTYIAYGAHLEASLTPDLVERLGVEPGRYLLAVGRLEPEKNVHLAVEAYRSMHTDMPLVIVGDTNWESPYARRLKTSGDERVKFVGGVYEPDVLRELYSNCYVYIHGNEVGGTGPALLTALSHGCCVAALDVVFNREVLAGGHGMFFEKSPSSLAGVLERLLGDPELAESFRATARARVEEAYTWDRICDQYELLCRSLLDGRYRPGWPASD